MPHSDQPRSRPFKCSCCGLELAAVTAWPVRCACGRVTFEDGSCTQGGEKRRGKPVVAKLLELKRRVLVRSEARGDTSLTDLAVTLADTASQFMPHASLGEFLAKRLESR